MRKFPSLAAAAVLVATVGGGAQATVVFNSGNNPQPHEENIMFETQQTGTTITGDTNQTGTTVQFTSTQNLMTQGVGQANLEASSANTITGSVTFTVPGMEFIDYILNPAVTGPDANGSPATLTAISNDGTFTQGITLGNGNNFWTITTTVGEFLTSVELSLAAGSSYFQYEQPRVSGVCTPGEVGCTLAPPLIIPEPGTMALLGSALVGFGAFRRRKRTRERHLLS